MDQQKSYTNKDIARALNMKPSTIAYYTNKGFIVPDVDQGEGRGTTRRYSSRNLLEFMLIGELSRHGMSLDKILEILYQARVVFPKKALEERTGKEPQEGKWNIYAAYLDPGDVFAKLWEVFIIIYDDDEVLQVELRGVAKRKNDDELRKMSKDEVRLEIKKWLSFRVDMYDHESALVINITKLWERLTQA